MEKEYYVYFITNKHLNVLYNGVTSDLIRRVFEHKNKLADGFSKKYQADRLVYYESYSDIYEAITREKQIKGWVRKRKNELVDSINPSWSDLYESLF